MRLGDSEACWVFGEHCNVACAASIMARRMCAKQASTLARTVIASALSSSENNNVDALQPWTVMAYALKA